MNLLERLFLPLVFAAAFPAAVSAEAPRPLVAETTPLAAEELGARQRVYFDLKMRNFSELQARIARGEILSPLEMTDRYLPTAEAWQEVAAWASANGYSVVRPDDAHMTVFAISTVGRIQANLRVPLGRFGGSGEIGYAPVAGKPSLPAAIEDRISGVIFPQPRHRAQVTVPPGLFQTSGGVLFFTPQIVAQAYGVSGLGLDGTGQTIVVLGGSTVNPADLTAFWTNCGLPTTASQFTEIDPFPQFTNPNSDASEETKDIEWSSAMAPKARILYVSSIDPETLLSVLMPLLPRDSSIHQVNST